MLKRQKVLLGLILIARRRPTRTELMKWLFLLWQETCVSSDISFYDFVPYKYGPFSFQVYRDLDCISSNGYLQPDALAIPEAMLPQAQHAFRSLPSQVLQAVTRVYSQYGLTTIEELLQYVYERYPWYASRSELAALTTAVSCRSDIAVYTAGYEGQSVDGFFDKLLRAGIECLVDVRNNPVSRKYGFARGSMQRICEKLGLRYIHLPELGIPSELRRTLESYEDYQKLLNIYETTVLPSLTQYRELAESLISERPSVLVCFEADPQCCHRSRLAKVISFQTGLATTHL